MSLNEISIAGQQRHRGALFPAAVSCDRSLVFDLPSILEWVKRNHWRVEELLAERGVVLFRGFPVASDRHFDAFVAAFHYENFSYAQSLSNAVRTNRTERIFTANEAPPEVRIRLHHELAQTPAYPGKLFFFCEEAPGGGGATPVCRSDILFEALVERCRQFICECEDRGLRYTNVMPPENDLRSGMGRSWRSTLGVETKAEAERRLRELGYNWEWMGIDCLRVTTPVLPAILELAPGRRVFFNQLIAASFGWKDQCNHPSNSVTFGDGTALDRDAVRYAAELAEELAVNLEWQTGDVALVDNRIAMHGRQPFHGRRSVLASLAV